MAFASSKYHSHNSDRGLTFGEGLRWVALPGAGMAIAVWSASIIAGMGSIGTTLSAASTELPSGLSLSTRTGFDPPSRLQERNGTGDGKSARVFASLSMPPKSERLPDLSPAARFTEAVTGAALSPEKLASAFVAAAAKQKFRYKASQAMGDAEGLPTGERFGRLAMTGPAAPVMAARFGDVQAERSFDLALAAVAPTTVDTLTVLMPSLPESVSPDGGASTDQDVAPQTMLPGFETSPDAVPLPPRRPQIVMRPGNPAIAEARPDKPDTRMATRAPASRNPPIGRQPLMRSERSAGTLLAYASPDDPTEDASGVFKNLFSSPGKNSGFARAGGGVAVYDISAKTVKMPDGSTLEAHSGIGSMVDNPRYIDKKMGGPTPPDTYNLVMRESRFHGVEAIRLLPVDGRVKHGRTGLLAHSYLLRGGKAQSHGCVAFKDYARFLAAFKKGKIKRLVVVS